MPILEKSTEKIKGNISMELDETYKHIEIEKQGNILVIKLFQDGERSIIHFVRIVFVDRKIFYSGDMGTYVFGKDIVHPLSFFKGKKIDPEYWWGKCEAAQYPIYDDLINPNKVLEQVKKVLCKEYGVPAFNELDEYIKEEYDKFIINEHEDEKSEMFTNISDLFNSLGIEDAWELTDDCISYGQEMNLAYIYCCNVLQWVENNLEKWLKDRKIEYSEQPSR